LAGRGEGRAAGPAGSLAEERDARRALPATASADTW